MSVANHIINFLTNTAGLRNAKDILATMNSELSKTTGMSVNVTGIEKLARDADNASTALIRFRDAQTGAVGTARAKFQQQRLAVGPPGATWVPGARGGTGAWRGAGGQFIKSPAGVITVSV